MKILGADKLKQHLQENFPYLPRLWGRATYDDFLAGGQVDQNLIQSSRSPFQMISNIIEQEFPRFHHRLIGQGQVVMLNVLIELTLVCYPGCGEVDLLNFNAGAEPDPHELACAIGRYLHRFL